MRTWPSSLTLIGNTDVGSAEDMIDGRPWASRRPRTIAASTADCVRKMTTGSAMFDRYGLQIRLGRKKARVFDLEQDHRHVVVLRRGADERRDFTQQTVA